MLELAKEKREDPFLDLLDNIEDPHNRRDHPYRKSCRCTWCDHSEEPRSRLTATVAKTSAGALNYTPVAKVQIW